MGAFGFALPLVEIGGDGRGWLEQQSTEVVEREPSDRLGRSQRFAEHSLDLRLGEARRGREVMHLSFAGELGLISGRGGAH